MNDSVIKTYINIADACLSGEEDTFEPFQIVEVLETADDYYYNGEESFLTDNQYDTLRKIAERLDPSNTYFLGIGSDVRGGKVKLPVEMGSLDQIDIGLITDWVGDWLLQEEELVVSDKLDGVSAMIVYDRKGQLQIAYSRGNGVEGADITRHISKVANLPKKISQGMKVRAEAILSETAFKKLQGIVKSRSGRPYKNARNMVSGLMNAKTNPAVVYDYLSVVVYQILDSDMSKRDQLDTLETEGFEVVNWSLMHGKELTDDGLAFFLNERRSQSDYALDGVVIDVNSAKRRKEMNPSRETLNPAYSIKYKVADASNLAQAKVVNVEWNVSKHGYLKPRVQIEPVQLVGVTVTNCNGFNGKFIRDNNVGPGSVIEITRSGDVIPYILKVVTSTKAQLPDTDYTWTVNDKGEEVDCVQENAHLVEEVMVKQVADFFTLIEAPHLKIGNVQQMFDWNKYTDATHAIQSMMHYNRDHWISCVGANGAKIYDGLHEKLSQMPLWKLAGSMPTFGRGIGRRKIKKLQKAIGFDKMMNGKFTFSQVIGVEGFETKTADKICTNWSAFLDFVNSVSDVVTMVDDLANVGSSMAGQKVVFTGFRDSDLEQAVVDAGGEMQSSVSSKTTILVAKDPNSGSGKVKKAAEKGVKVIGIDDLRAML